jgi:hypothetical protein
VAVGADGGVAAAAPSNDVTLLISGIGEQLRELRAGLESNVADLKSRFDGLESRFDGLESRFDGLESNVADLKSRFDGLESRFDGLESRFGGLESKVDGLVTSVNELLEVAPTVAAHERIAACATASTLFVEAPINCSAFFYSAGERAVKDASAGSGAGAPPVIAVVTAAHCFANFRRNESVSVMSLSGFSLKCHLERVFESPNDLAVLACPHAAATSAAAAAAAAAPPPRRRSCCGPAAFGSAWPWRRPGSWTTPSPARRASACLSSRPSRSSSPSPASPTWRATGTTLPATCFSPARPRPFSGGSTPRALSTAW